MGVFIMGNGLDIAQIKMCIDCIKMIKPVFKPMMKQIIESVKESRKKG